MALVAVKMFITILRFLFFFFSLLILTDSTVDRRVTVSRTLTGPVKTQATADYRLKSRDKMQPANYRLPDYTLCYFHYRY